ncbi:MAG: PD-(D/E)XK nuclease family protein [Gammaproteobacteria bacterium]|nr:PD-(D/E)XK nuclease family protein [Gammaproteobacteria bacterium]
MRITFGLHLDGEQGWRPAHRLGEPVLGPLGLLDLLETQLGLLRAECPLPERVTQYRECLRRLDAPARFYHASFGIDPVGTAATLLSWRDIWQLHGWSGECARGAGARIADLAAVEVAARELLVPSIGERLARVAGSLRTRPVQVECLELADPQTVFPRRWQEVLAQLPVREAAACQPAADPGTVLGKLQRALRAAHDGVKSEEKIAWADDGSLRVVRAETALVAARWLAHELTTSQKDVALVAGERRTLLDVTLDAADVARQGFQDPSPLAPALQLLPLALALVWEPLDVHALLQFLAHPVGPVPGYARQRLAEVVAEFPGIGGPRWRAAVGELLQRHPQRAAELRQALASWVEHARYGPGQGAPIAMLLQRSRAIRAYFSARLVGADANRAAAAATGAAQAGAVTAALEAFAARGESTLARAELEALVAQCMARGAPNSALHAQVGRVPSVSDPGALLESFDRVIWWQMGAPALPPHYPWSARELASLAEAGVALPPLAEVLQRRSEDALRPVLKARRQLVLVLPPQGAEVHPLWQEIQWLAAGVQPVALENILAADAGSGLPPLVHAPLPRRRRWWTLPRTVQIPARPRESYSSLDVFLNAPHQWVLQYAARLSPSNLLGVADTNRLYGNLAHRLIERFFRMPGALALGEDARQAWFAREFAAVVAEEGAVLRLPGRRGDCERLRHAVQEAIAVLQRQFVAAGVEAVEPERALAGRFRGGELEGVADLVVRKRSGESAIVDMKWSGGNHYRERLVEDRHLQLLVYAQLLQQETGAWPGVAYFILEAARLLALDERFFPAASAVPSRATESLELLWERFIAAWQWRRSQLDAGAIEVAVEGIEPTPESTAPAAALAPEALRADYDDYRWLAGWED